MFQTFIHESMFGNFKYTKKGNNDEHPLVSYLDKQNSHKRTIM